MESQQPYRPPGARVGQRPAAPSGGGGISPRALAAMEKTRPWVRFLSGMMMVLCLLLVILGVVMLIAGGIAGASSELGGIAGLGGAALGAVYFFAALLYLFPALYLWRYSGAIRQIGRSNTVAFDEALEHQASFWRFVGITALVVVAIYAAIFVIAAIVAVIGAGAGG